MPDKCSCYGLHVVVTVFVLFFSSAKSVLSSLFSFSGAFSSILLTVFFSLQHIFNTFSHKDVLFTVFWNTFKLFYCFACKIKSCLLKTTAIFLLNFVVKIALIWLVLVGFFVFSANQKPLISNLYLSYRLALVLQENCTPLLSQSEYSNSCILLEPLNV